MKNKINILIGILAILVVLSFAKDLTVKVALEKGMELVTGLKLRVSSISVGILNTSVGIRDLRLYNPAGYEDKIMLDMPEIYVNYDLAAFLRGKVHLEEVRIDMNEFVVVKNAKGELNLDSLNVVKAEKSGKKPAQEAAGKAPEISIDKLRLKIGKVTYKDYSKGGAPAVQEFNVNLDETYSNIDDPYALVSLIVVKSLANTSIAKATNFNVNGLSNTISNTLSTATKTATEAAGKLGTTAQQATQEVTKQAGETVKKTSEAVKNMLPFGKKE